jgi:hypothetical protein
MSTVLSQPQAFAERNASPSVPCKRNCKREYEDGDPKPDPSPDILLNRDSHRFTLRPGAHIPFNPFNVKSCCKSSLFRCRRWRRTQRTDAFQDPLRAVYIHSRFIITIQLSCSLEWRLNAIRSTLTRVRAGPAAKGLEDAFGAYFLELWVLTALFSLG